MSNEFTIGKYYTTNSGKELILVYYSRLHNKAILADDTNNYKTHTVLLDSIKPSVINSDIVSLFTPSEIELILMLSPLETLAKSNCDKFTQVNMAKFVLNKFGLQDIAQLIKHPN